MPGMLVIVLTFIGDYVNLSVVVLTLAVTMLGGLSTGHYPNPIDIAPNFAGKIGIFLIFTKELLLIIYFPQQDL